MIQKQSFQVIWLLDRPPEDMSVGSLSQWAITAQPGLLLTVALLMSKKLPAKGFIRTLKKKKEKKKNMLTSVHGEMTYFEVFNIALIIQQYL